MAFLSSKQNNCYVLPFISSEEKGHLTNEEHLNILSCTVDEDTVKIFFINRNETVILLQSSDLKKWTEKKLTNVIFHTLNSY